MEDVSKRTLLAVTAGYFIVMFAVSPVAVMLPALAASLQVNVDAAGWVMTAFLLPLTAFLLPAGRLGDIFGHRRLFVAGLGLTVAGAVGAGIAGSLWLLLGARALQGLGAALVSATSLPIITAVVGPERRARSIGLATMASSLGAMSGTALAPLVLQYLTWRWAFFTGALAGLVALSLAWRMGLGPRPASRVRFDWPGAMLLLLTLGVASLSLSHFHDGPESFTGGWHWHLPMHLAALVLLAMFVAVESRVRAPLIRLDQLRNGVFTTAIGANGVLHMTMMMATFSVPFLIQRGLRLGAMETGVLLVAMQACTTAMTLAGGWLYDRTRWVWLCPLALGMVASGLTWLGLAAPGLTYAQAFVAMLWLGLGSGTFMTTNNTRIMGTLAAEYRGFASGMLERTRQYGHTLGVAVAAVGLAAALGSDSVAAAATVRAGFGQSALLMGAIAWAGVALAAYPMYAARARRWLASSQGAAPRGATSEAAATLGVAPAAAASSR